jgi:ferredoxin
MSKIRIQVELCRWCGMCVEICPEGLFTQSAPDRPPRIRRAAACISCGHCVSTCPSGAIQHDDFPPEDWLKPHHGNSDKS